jgi:hypothetical protein
MVVCLATLAVGANALLECRRCGSRLSVHELDADRGHQPQNEAELEIQESERLQEVMRARPKQNYTAKEPVLVALLPTQPCQASPPAEPT